MPLECFERKREKSLNQKKIAGVEENEAYVSKSVREQEVLGCGWGVVLLTQQNPPVFIKPLLPVLLLSCALAPSSNCGSRLIKKHGCP